MKQQVLVVLLVLFSTEVNLSCRRRIQKMTAIADCSGAASRAHCVRIGVDSRSRTSNVVRRVVLALVSPNSVGVA